MSKFEKINAFIHVVENNGFAAAGKKLHLSTAAISRQVTALEAELGAQLLLRTTRQLSLTNIGKQYYQQCKQVLSYLAQAENAIAGSKKEATGTLNVTTNRYFGMKHIIPYLPIFSAENPKLHIKLELAERFPDLVKENVDILFGVSLEGPPDLVRRRILTTRYILCASPKYIKKFGMPESPADLHKHRYITHSMRQPVDTITFKDGKEIVLDPILSLNDTRAIFECAILGMGIMKLHDYEVADALKNKSLIEVLPEFSGPDIPVYLYYQQSRHLLPKIRRFLDFYTDESRGLKKHNNKI